MRNSWGAWAGVIAVGLVGCGDDSGGASFAGFEGIYEITSYTENTAGCDSAGASILGDVAPMLASVEISFFGKVLTLHPCEDAADCDAVAADARANNVFPFGDGFVFDRMDGNTARGTTTIAGGSGSECSGRVIEHTLTRADDGSIQIESRTQETGPFAPDAEGFCTTEAATAAAAGQPCTELVTINAEHVDTL